jgi:SWI/SNF-related matrix-associated actin-dependent regulator 1 of chromatin subfamily A
LLHMIDPDEFQSFHQFANVYCVPKLEYNKITYKESRNMPALHGKLQKHMLRRLKEEVLPQLPPIMRSVVPVTLTGRDAYEAALKPLDAFKGRDLDQKEKVSALAALGVARMAAANGKVKPVIEWLEEWFDDGGGKFALFGFHVAALQQVAAHFGKSCVRIQGDVSPKDRQEIVKRFQTDPAIKLFVGNITASGEGITLTAAADIGFMELDYTPAKNDQVIARLHRMGQLADHVTVRYFIARDTIDERVMAINDRKVCDVRAITDGVDVKVEDLLQVLLQ